MPPIQDLRISSPTAKKVMKMTSERDASPQEILSFQKRTQIRQGAESTKPKRKALVIHPPRPQLPEKKRFMMEGRKDSSEFNKWFFTTNNLLENQSSRHIFGETSKAIIPKIKSPQNKYLGKLFEDDLFSRRNIYERKRSTTVGEREKYVYINK